MAKGNEEKYESIAFTALSLGTGTNGLSKEGTANITISKIIEFIKDRAGNFTCKTIKFADKDANISKSFKGLLEKHTNEAVDLKKSDPEPAPQGPIIVKEEDGPIVEVEVNYDPNVNEFEKRSRPTQKKEEAPQPEVMQPIQEKIEVVQ